jgi:cobalt-zinc-cadmium efflux system outer membrane protein
MPDTRWVRLEGGGQQAEVLLADRVVASMLSSAAVPRSSVFAALLIALAAASPAALGRQAATPAAAPPPPVAAPAPSGSSAGVMSGGSGSAGAGGGAEGAGGGGALSLPEAIALAMAANRTLAAARLARPIAGANVAVAGERPNPDLLLEALRETPRQAATLSLPIETAGKRRRRVAVAEADAGTGEAEIARATATIRNRVRRAFYALLAAQRRLAEDEAIVGLVQRAAGAAGDRFEAGAAPRLDVLQAQLSAAQASNEAEAARAQLLAARSDLNTLIDRPPQSVLAAAGDLTAGAVLETGSATAAALAASTELVLLDRRIATQAAKVALARAQQVPNPVVQGAITHDAPPDFVWGWRAGLTVTLPIFTTHRAEVQVEEATLTQLRAERDATAAQVAGQVTAAVAQASAAQGQALRFRDDILPRSRDVEGLAEESYRAGETGLVALLQVLQSARDLRLRAVQAGLDYQVALADLEQALGAPLP